MLWDNNVHQKWMDQVKLNVKENHHLLNEENYQDSGCKYIGAHLFVSLNVKDDLKKL
jgi:hypothetical protein